MATEYATLTFVADTSGLERAETQLNAVARTGTRTQRSVDNLSTSAKAVAQSLNNVGNDAFLASKQIRGIIGPADTSAGALLRLRNQSTEAGGAAARTGVNVAGMGRNAGQAGIQIQQLVGQVQAGTNPLVAFSQQATDLGIVLGAPLIGAALGLGSALVMTLIPALMDSGDAMDDLTSDIDGMIDKLDEFTEAQREAAALQVAESLREQREEYRKTASRIDGLRARLAEATSNTRSLFDNMRPEEIQDLRDEITAASGVLDTQAQELERLNDQYEILTGQQEVQSESQKQAAEDAERFTQRLQEQADTAGLNREQTILYKAAQMELNEEQMRAVEIAARRIQAFEDEERARQEQKRRDRELERESQAAISELRQQGLIDREENEFQSLERRRQQLEQFRQQELISERQYQEASKNLERETQEAKVKVVSDTVNALGAINEDAFKIAKAFNIANAIMNTYTGATKALATYPPPFNFIAAAGVVANGLAQVSQIRSQSYSGRALGGQVRAGESYVVGERGPEVLTMGAGGGRIIPNEAMRGSGGGEQSVNRTTNVTFHISTVDARGFDQLLQSRRGQIISMINSASNDRGRRAVV